MARAGASGPEQQRAQLKVLYDFEYDTRGKRVRIVKDERLLLLNRTNDDWWQVVRPADLVNSFVPELSTFYVPTPYVIEIDPLPDTTRFYVDNDKMFKPDPPPQQHVEPEPRKAHDSFRSVIRKLSGNLGNDASKQPKPAKPSKIIKSLRKNSMDSEEAKPHSNKSSLVPAKHKDTWEHSAFGMCFGRDTKNVDAQMLNPFQEELENALSNRVTQKRHIVDSKVGLGKQVDQVCDDRDKASKFESIQNKWEKVSAQVLKKSDNLQKLDNSQTKQPLSKIKEELLKRRSISPSFQVKKEGTTSSCSSVTQQSTETDKLYSVVEKSPKKPVQQLADKKSNASSESVDIESTAKDESVVVHDTPSNKDIDRLLINDKRKMWAIETLMSELMQSSLHSKTVASNENNETGISGPNQLAQELHEMNVSRSYENAEIQVNLLDSKDNNNTKENEQLNTDKKCKVESYKKKVFDFPPRSGMIKAPISPTARSPKLLDEYNEANILNDNDRPREMQNGSVGAVDYGESPSYSNISSRIRRDKVPCKLKMPTKDFREELQLTPSLEKLANEIQFLPASANSTDIENEKNSLDFDCPTTTLSQDSLRLYKRRSKSDGALNRREPPRRNSVNSQRNPATSASHMEIFETLEEQPVERMYEPQRGKYESSECNLYLRSDRVSQTTRYKLNRKSRSLGDLDCSDLDEKKESSESESKRRYKPVPKLRSKESLRRLKCAPLVVASSSERLITNRPVPAKRRALQQQEPQACPRTVNGSLDELREVDIDRSTAVGFKSLLHTSDSGSEEYLQYKTFPATGKSQQSPDNISRSNSNVNNMNRSLSDEVILSSTSSVSPSRILDGSVENLVDLPPGWTQTYDNNAKRVCFINKLGDKWFSSNDSEGKIYFFEENSNESSWALPSISPGNRVRTISNGDWPQLFDGNMCILKEGVINKTKITTENGKKLRKTWSTSYAVLTELFLLFFKDAKTFATMKMDQSAAAKPDICVDLNGAFIEPTDKLSNRRNVYLINTLLGLQVLIQSDNSLVITEWYREIHDAIQRLPFSQDYGRSSSTRE